MFVSNTNEGFQVMDVNDSGLVIETKKEDRDVICRTQTLPKREVIVVPGIIKLDQKYRDVFKNIREYDEHNIYQCLGKMDPLLSKHK